MVRAVSPYKKILKEAAETVLAAIVRHEITRLADLVHKASTTHGLGVTVTTNISLTPVSMVELKKESFVKVFEPNTTNGNTVKPRKVDFVGLVSKTFLGDGYLGKCYLYLLKNQNTKKEDIGYSFVVDVDHQNIDGLVNSPVFLQHYNTRYLSGRPSVSDMFAHSSLSKNKNNATIVRKLMAKLDDAINWFVIVNYYCSNLSMAQLAKHYYSTKYSTIPGFLDAFDDKQTPMYTKYLAAEYGDTLFSKTFTKEVAAKLVKGGGGVYLHLNDVSLNIQVYQTSNNVYSLFGVEKAIIKYLCRFAVGDGFSWPALPRVKSIYTF
jgi:hypothetical protein